MLVGGDGISTCMIFRPMYDTGEAGHVCNPLDEYESRAIKRLLPFRGHWSEAVIEMSFRISRVITERQTGNVGVNIVLGIKTELPGHAWSVMVITGYVVIKKRLVIRRV